MRILLIEDDERGIQLVSEVAQKVGGINLDVAHHKEEGIEFLESESFDLILCDLRIPPTANSLDASVEHGLAVQAASTTCCPGTPLVFLTAFATPRNITSQLSLGAVADLYGLKSVPLVQLCIKGDPAELERILRNFSEALLELESSCLVEPPGDHPAMMLRAVRTYAKDLGSTRAFIRPLSGLSGADVATVQLAEPHGGTASVFVKVVDRDVAQDELNRYHQFVPNHLQPGDFAPALPALMYGLQKKAALLSTLADDQCRSLFQVLTEDPETALAAVRSLKAALLPWHGSATSLQSTVGELRREHLPDDKAMALQGHFAHLQDHETINLEVAMSIIHGDLHGENVLLDVKGRPILIDFGDVRVGPSALDPVTLELSVLFHKDGPARGHRWPRTENLRAWSDVDRYAAGSPYQEFIRACRKWALETDTLDAISAVAYSHALRQLKYPDCQVDVAVGIAEGAMAAIRE